MVTFEIQPGYFLIWDGKTKYPYRVHGGNPRDYPLEPDFIYGLAVKNDLSESETIDLMLKYLHKRRMVKIGHLAGLSLCVALIGVRGSGKSVGATQIAVVDGLLAGRKVVSNMPIQIKVKYRDAEKVFETEDLDVVSMLDINDFNENYEDCWIVVDESNINIADAYRSTTNQAMFFGMILQQMRHRKLDFLFTTQTEDMNTSRVRGQIDIYISCRDYAMISKNGEIARPRIHDLGRKSRWELYDMSGIVTGEVKRSDRRTHEIQSYGRKVVWNTPFWNCYSTDLMQRWEKHKFGQKKEAVGNFDADYLMDLANRQSVAIKAVINAIRMNLTEIKKSDLWKVCQIEGDRSSQTMVGSFLTGQLNIATKHGTGGDFYVFPSQAEIIKRLSEIGFEVEIE